MKLIYATLAASAIAVAANAATDLAHSTNGVAPGAQTTSMSGLWSPGGYTLVWTPSGYVQVSNQQLHPIGSRNNAYCCTSPQYDWQPPSGLR